MKNKPFTIWFTGISRSGKSTLANMLCESLSELGLKAESLDSGRIRKQFSSELGYSRDEIERNLKRLAYECQMLNRNGVIAIVAAISPFKAPRDSIRSQVGAFVEVFCDATVEELSDRDSHGLFERAKRNEIANVAGVNAPYEAPEKPEVHLKTGQDPPEKCLAAILKSLEILDYIPAGRSSAYTPDEEELIKSRFRKLGYI